MRPLPVIFTKKEKEQPGVLIEIHPSLESSYGIEAPYGIIINGDGFLYAINLSDIKYVWDENVSRLIDRLFCEADDRFEEEKE